MAIVKYAVGLVATSLLAAQPCVAADAFQDFDRDERRSAAFGGLKLNMPIGQGQRVKPTARLQLTTTHQLRDTRTGEVRAVTPAGLEFGASDKGKPMLFVGGRDAAAVKKELGIGGTTTTLLIVGGVVLVLLVVAAASTPPQVDYVGVGR
jgi:hypothetical protein